MENKEREKWFDLLKEQKAFCYIKPSRHRHESGFRCFEVGYLLLDKEGTRCSEKLVLGECSDHLQLYNYNLSTKSVSTDIMPNMDLLLDGYIRIFDFKKPLWWGNTSFVVSSAQLEPLVSI